MNSQEILNRIFDLYLKRGDVYNMMMEYEQAYDYDTVAAFKEEYNRIGLEIKGLRATLQLLG